MTAVPIKWKGMTLHEKLNIIQIVEANPNTTHVWMFMLFLHNF
jgi:hypothetical protein